LASISGAIWGALFIQFIPNVADQISKAAPWAIYGIFLIGFMYAMPTGVAGFIRMLVARRRRKLAPVTPGGAPATALPAAPSDHKETP
jgi:branched-chain amino acid transport system permease protein